ncbi:hypothetical protein LWC34_00170 [Kibdelosporangium philippinense]|uniref:Uncharacterized protein n=1 Tax=Kibdelosporangium philippinense TaxID=211113 RepID=A0ABS8Z3V1_9PSEU|nr:hypothetical protein [Kibdelosporangium philippinense]MCE7001263.1 hypothetical protein [Kibdelosporangium philippinense]
MEWTTPEAVKAQVEYRRGDMVAQQHIRAIRESQPPRWWQRIRVHRSEDTKGDRDAA